ncbi:alpha/beta fold hydrolase [Xinfangfangia sp. D13-10-4-6]|uniref:alpha/beta hydrolase n=1 Tax=Pseudogemmobacter hezensis TaxID=2737662 RepID=UPI00155466BD|nr:alpha/beta fold hydrolase [Pseudogemmobacter hezensis]NPD14266.1 alpha/beta fold hydrolase [Pseudogemmobacter hezensis]
MRVFIALMVLVVFASCSPRGNFVMLEELTPEKIAIAEDVTIRVPIYVGTSRREVDGEFGFQRSEHATFMRYDILLPKEHKIGEVTWPKSVKRADPARDFLTLADQQFASDKDFRKDLGKNLGRKGSRDVVVYVHGFNNTMAESIYRVAQMHYDLKVPGVAVHYAWPSRGSALGYVYDRDSALFGRDGLEELLREVADAGAERIIIVAHSMGAALTMETLRQASIRGDRKVMDRMAGVILISPDLDVDLFRAQAHAMGKLPQPFLIFGSTRDSILNLSSKLAGAPDRLGNLSDLTPIADLQVTYYDTAAYNQGAGHNNLGTSPALLQLLGGIANVDAAFRAEARTRVGLLPGVVLTVRNATAIVLSPVEAVATRNAGKVD